MLSALIFKQYDRVYRNSQWLRSHFTVLGHILLITMLLSGAFGIDTTATTSYQLFVFLLTLLVIAFLNSWFSRLQVSATRHLPRYFTVGEKSHYSIALSNEKDREYRHLALYEQLQDGARAPNDLADWFRISSNPWYKRGVSFRRWREYMLYRRGGMVADTPVPLLSKSSANKQTRVEIEFTPLRRGKLNFEAVRLACPDVLGLYRSMITIPSKQSCLILPKRYPLSPLRLAGTRKYQAGGVSLANSVGDSSEFISLREYRKGDPLNAIHWKSFARHGKLIVKEYQDEYFVRRALLLDTFADAVTNDIFEAAVSVAASVCMSERQNDALLDLMFVGETAHCFTSGRGIDHMPHIQEVLAAVQKSSSSFEHLKAAIHRHIHLCSSVVCVLLSWDENRQSLVQLLQAHNLPVAVFLVHDGSIQRHTLIHQPEHFYLIDHHKIAADLGAI